MSELPFNLLDGAIVAVLIASGLFAFMRGFVKEVLAVAGWIGAIVVTFWMFPELRFFARRYIELELIADGVTIFAIFVVALIAFSFVSHAIARLVKESGLGFLDRTLGFVFGLVRGAVVVCLAYLLLVWLVPPEDHPEWVETARLRPLVAYGGEQLRRLAPKETLNEVGIDPDALKTRAEEALDGEQTLERLLNPQLANGKASRPDSEGETGYKDDQRQRLDQLIESQEAQ